jgi:DNA helicase MCM9
MGAPNDASGMVKLLEAQKKFECLKCQARFSMMYDREQHNLIPKPFKCLGNKECESTKFKEVVVEVGQLPDSCLDYQEIRVQEDASKLAIGAIPKSITIVLESDLVDQCKAGDNVAITGVVYRRWRSFVVNERCDVEIFLLANNMKVYNQQTQASSLSEEAIQEFKTFWKIHRADPLQGKEEIPGLSLSRV